VAIAESVVGASTYLAFALVVFGYWLTMYEARVGAGLAGYVLGLGVGVTAGPTVGLAAGVVGALAFAAVAHVDDRLGWGASAAATGALLGAGVGGGATTLVGVGAGVALAAVLGALAWKFPRGTLPVTTGVLGALLVGVAFGATGGTGGSSGALTNLFATAVVLGGFVAVMLQPWTAEIGDTVPPLLPLTVRNWFDLVPEGGVDDAVCPTCGEAVDPNAPYCANCDASLAGMVGPADAGSGASAGAGGAGGSTVTDVPDDAAAVDVPCPQCGDRPIEEHVTGVGLVGMLLAYRWSKRSVVGCHGCNRSRLWRLAGKNMALGWWSIVSVFANPFTILWNVGRGLVNRGPNASLARHLAEAGIDFEYLADPSEFDPSEHADHELLLRGLLRLGVAVMLADGQTDRREAAAIRDSALELFPEQDAGRIEDRIQSYAGETTNAAKVASGLRDTLTTEGRGLALRFAGEVAVADGDVDDAEAELLATVADELDLSEDAVETAIGAGVDPDAAPTGAGAV